jgi:hypothetical protein
MLSPKWNRLFPDNDVGRALCVFFVIIYAWIYPSQRPGCLWMALRFFWLSVIGELLLTAEPSWQAVNPLALVKIEKACCSFFQESLING